MVLFMFTVMFLILRDDSLNFDAQNVPLKISLVLAVILITAMFVQTLFMDTFSNLKISNIGVEDNFGSVQNVGTSIFTDYILPFELTSILIVVAIIGVIVISKRRID